MEWRKVIGDAVKGTVAGSSMAALLAFGAPGASAAQGDLDSERLDGAHGAAEVASDVEAGCGSGCGSKKDDDKKGGDDDEKGDKEGNCGN